MENRKSTACAICWLKSVLHEKKRRTGSDSGRTNATKTVSDVFRHRSEIGKLYCRTRFDVGLERVKQLFDLFICASLSFDILFTVMENMQIFKVFSVRYVLLCIYRVIQKDGLNFVRLYFLNYTRYVNDLQNI
jgi:hypothetical protein